MKTNRFPFCAVLAVGMLAACSDNDSNGSDITKGDVDAPKVVSVTPAPDAVDIDTFSQVVITYDEPIYRPTHTTIRVNGEYVEEGVKAVGNQLIIPVTTKGGKEYKVEVLKPTVRDSAMNFAPDFSMTVATRIYNNFEPSLFTLDQQPCNPNANEDARKLYQFLLDHFGKQVIAGAMADVAWNTNWADTLYQRTGKYPALNCFDFIHHNYSRPLGNANWIDYTDTKVVEQWHQQGGIVACMWHWNVPDKPADSLNLSKYTFNTNTTFTAYKAVRATGNSFEYRRATRDMNVIADYLLALQDKGIAVLWRPLHEASGNVGVYNGGEPWFWWGCGPKGHEADSFKRLWRRMFDLFKERGVNNLIWVWTSNGVDADWYPGDDYVDIIARDYYENDANLLHASLITEWNKLNAISNRKMLTLGECGAIPSMQNMIVKGDLWSWFMPWYGSQYFSETINSTEFLKEMFNSSYVLTRDEIGY